MLSSVQLSIEEETTSTQPQSSEPNPQVCSRKNGETPFHQNLTPLTEVLTRSLFSPLRETNTDAESAGNPVWNRPEGNSTKKSQRYLSHHSNVLYKRNFFVKGIRSVTRRMADYWAMLSYWTEHILHRLAFYPKSDKPIMAVISKVQINTSLVNITPVLQIWHLMSGASSKWQPNNPRLSAQ